MNTLIMDDEKWSITFLASSRQFGSRTRSLCERLLKPSRLFACKSRASSGSSLKRNLEALCSLFFLGKKNISETELYYQGDGDIIIAPVIEGGKRRHDADDYRCRTDNCCNHRHGRCRRVRCGRGVGRRWRGRRIDGYRRCNSELSPQAGGLRTSAAPEN